MGTNPSKSSKPSKPRSEPSDSSRNPLTKDLFVGKPGMGQKDYITGLKLDPNASWADICTEQNRRYYAAVGQHLNPERIPAADTSAPS